MSPVSINARMNLGHFLKNSVFFRRIFSFLSSIFSPILSFLNQKKVPKSIKNWAQKKITESWDKVGEGEEDTLNLIEVTIEKTNNWSNLCFEWHQMRTWMRWMKRFTGFEIAWSSGMNRLDDAWCLWNG